MKLLRYSRDNKVCCGILTDNGIVDVSALDIAPACMKEILERGSDFLKELESLATSADTFIPLSEVKLLAPVESTSKLIALAGNYTKHILEAGKTLGLSDSPEGTTVPRPFIMPNTVISNPNDEIPWPSYSEDVDYEVELAVVIGKKAKCVPVKDALDYIAGYTIANDISARTVTFKENRTERPWDEFYDWLNGKWSDGFLPVGPYIVTSDEIGDPQKLDIKQKVNGETRQNANTAQMIFGPAQIVSFTSHLMTLQPGDIISTGTPEGVGMATGNFLKPGDKLECEIQKIGTLKNSLGQHPEEFYKPLDRKS